MYVQLVKLTTLRYILFKIKKTLWRKINSELTINSTIPLFQLQEQRTSKVYRSPRNYCRRRFNGLITWPDVVYVQLVCGHKEGYIVCVNYCMALYIVFSAAN